MQGDDKGYQVCKKKMDLNADKLCKPEWPEAFSRFTQSVLALRWDEEPKYSAYMALFKPFTGNAASRPITLHLAKSSGAGPALQKVRPARRPGYVCLLCCSLPDVCIVYVGLRHAF